MAATETIVRVSRKLFPQTYSGHVETKNKGWEKDMFVPDEVRHNMPGEREAWFEVDKDGDKIVFKRRVPKPIDWDWPDDYFGY